MRTKGGCKDEKRSMIVHRPLLFCYYYMIMNKKIIVGSLIIIFLVTVCILTTYILLRQPSDDQTKITFEFPAGIPTEYIHTVDWPPIIQTIAEKLSCTEAGTETTRAGKTEKKIINGRTFCKTQVTEGAAGSVYTQYAYAFAGNDPEHETTILTFTLRAVQCANYDEDKRSACEKERASFDIDSIITNSIKNL